MFINNADCVNPDPRKAAKRFSHLKHVDSLPLVAPSQLSLPLSLWRDPRHSGRIGRSYGHYQYQVMIKFGRKTTQVNRKTISCNVEPLRGKSSVTAFAMSSCFM
jgi:hypothetical protein